MNTYKSILAAIIMVVLLTGCDGCQSENDRTPDDRDTIRHTEQSPPLPCVPNPDTSALDMQTIYQEQGNWCWAACGEMVMEFKGAGNMTQCDQVNDLLNARNCCQDPLPLECDSGGIPQFLRYGFSVDSILRALTWEETKVQIDCKQSPVCAIWNYTHGGSHMVVLSGYTKIDGEDYVIVRNPSQDFRGVLINFYKYPVYVEAGYYTHGMNYYDIAQIESPH